MGRPMFQWIGTYLYLPMQYTSVSGHPHGDPQPSALSVRPIDTHIPAAYVNYDLYSQGLSLRNFAVFSIIIPANDVARCHL